MHIRDHDLQSSFEQEIQSAETACTSLLRTILAGFSSPSYVDCFFGFECTCSSQLTFRMQSRHRWTKASSVGINTCSDEYRKGPRFIVGLSCEYTFISSLVFWFSAGEQCTRSFKTRPYCWIGKAWGQFLKVSVANLKIFVNRGKQ